MTTNAATTAMDWTTFSRECPSVENEIVMPQPPEKVFDYVTTAALWHTWHPATSKVLDVPMRPLVQGETMLEVIAMLGMREQALWTVLVCEPHRHWEIATVTPRGDAHITYVVTPEGQGCRFRRTLSYRSKTLPWRWLDWWLLRWFLYFQSAQALRNLKEVLARSGN